MFITLEGPEGSGKTSQIPSLAAFLEDLGYNVITTREPGGTPISDQIREVLMSMKNQDLHPRTEILLFLAARAQLVEQVLKPALHDGKMVLCDRYADSTLAYQGYGHGFELSVLRKMLDFATDSLKPDLTLFLDLDVESGLARKKNISEWNRLDAYEVAFHKRVRAGYHHLIEEEPWRWVVIDATQEKETVQAAMRKAILVKLEEMKMTP
ncbi:MAG: dTMP kinase [Anaerolineaceae bacterium]|nr:dTMP kinase [Anaerolineaceae bacterium]